MNIAMNYTHFDIVGFCKDYRQKQSELEMYRAKLDSKTGESGIDYSAPRVQTSRSNDAIVNLVSDRMDIETQINERIEYFKTFDAALSVLTDDERTVIETFYTQGLTPGESLDYLEESGIKKSLAYTLKKSALDKMRRFIAW